MPIMSKRRIWRWNTIKNNIIRLSKLAKKYFNEPPAVPLSEMTKHLRLPWAQWPERRKTTAACLQSLVVCKHAKLLNRTRTFQCPNWCRNAKFQRLQGGSSIKLTFCSSKTHAHCRDRNDLRQNTGSILNSQNCPRAWEDNHSGEDARIFQHARRVVHDDANLKKGPQSLASSLVAIVTRRLNRLKTRPVRMRCVNSPPWLQTINPHACDKTYRSRIPINYNLLQSLEIAKSYNQHCSDAQPWLSYKASCISLNQR